MPPDRGEQLDGSLKPPPQPIHHPSPRPSRPAIFSLTPFSSSPSHQSPTASDDGSPDRNSGLFSSANPPSSWRYSISSEPQSPQDLSPSSAGMPVNEPQASGRATPPPTKSRSILNLTSSTLFGIYSPTGYDANRDEPETPWGSGAQTPALRNGGPVGFEGGKSLAERLQLRDEPKVLAAPRDYGRPRSGSGVDGQARGKKTRIQPSRTQYIFGLAWRLAALFILGMSYGAIITHLHDKRRIAPVEVQINRGSWYYLCSWGVLAAGLGFLLPWVDERWGGQSLQEHDKGPLHEKLSSEKGVDLDRRLSEDSIQEHWGAEWNPIVRSVGAFVGIAFAIRRLPWQSTLQVSLTLALVNPVIWYLLDRTRTGVALSFITGLTGAATMMGINPNIVPSPAPAATQPLQIGGQGGHALLGVTLEEVGVATWIGSVFFCSCVCFGNVGRRLTKGLS